MKTAQAEIEYVFIGSDGFVISTIFSEEYDNPEDKIRGVIMHMTLEELRQADWMSEVDRLYRAHPSPNYKMIGGFKDQSACREFFRMYIQQFDIGAGNRRPDEFYDQRFQILITGDALKRYRNIKRG